MLWNCRMCYKCIFKGKGILLNSPENSLAAKIIPTGKQVLKITPKPAK